MKYIGIISLIYQLPYPNQTKMAQSAYLYSNGTKVDSPPHPIISLAYWTTVSINLHCQSLQLSDPD